MSSLTSVTATPSKRKRLESGGGGGGALEAYGPVWECPLCAQVFPVTQVEAHLRSLHIGSLEDHWACVTCHFTAATFNDLAAHILLLGHPADRVERRSHLAQSLYQHLVRVQEERAPSERAQSQASFTLMPSYVAAPPPAPATPALHPNPAPKLKPSQTPPEPLELELEEAEEEDEDQETMLAEEAVAFQPLPSKGKTVDRIQGQVGGSDEVLEREFQLARVSGSFRCRLCKTPIAGAKVADGASSPNIYSMRGHVQAFHLRGPHLFGCPQCRHSGNRSATILAHVRKKHETAEATYTVLRPEAGPEVWALMEAAFPLIRQWDGYDASKRNVIQSFARPGEEEDL